MDRIEYDVSNSFIGSTDDGFDGDISIAVVTAIAAKRGVEPTELPPLYESIDPDALDASSRRRERAVPGAVDSSSPTTATRSSSSVAPASRSRSTAPPRRPSRFRRTEPIGSANPGPASETPVDRDAAVVSASADR